MAIHPGGTRRRAGMWCPGGARPLVIAHRGASAYRPEHTLEAYALAVRMGADAIEADLVSTADGVLVARHEPVLDHTTDVDRHARLRARRRLRAIDGVEREGVFAEDLRLAEVRRLRAVEPDPGLRRRSAAFDGRYAVPTLDEVLALRADLSRRLGRRVGVCLEVKHPSHHTAAGLDLAAPLVAALVRHGLAGPAAPAAVQCFEPGFLRRLAAAVATPLVQLVEPANAAPHLRRTADGHRHDALCTARGLRAVAGYAVAIGAHRDRVLPLRDGAPGPPGPLLADARAAGLAVHAWTFRSENRHLPPALRVPPRDAPPGTPPRPGDHGDALAELAAHLAAGVDALVTDHPDAAVKAAGGPRPAPPAAVAR